MGTVVVRQTFDSRIMQRSVMHAKPWKGTDTETPDRHRHGRLLGRTGDWRPLETGRREIPLPHAALAAC